MHTSALNKLEIYLTARWLGRDNYVSLTDDTVPLELCSFISLALNAQYRTDEHTKKGYELLLEDTEAHLKTDSCLLTAHMDRESRRCSRTEQDPSTACHFCVNNGYPCLRLIKHPSSGVIGIALHPLPRGAESGPESESWQDRKNWIPHWGASLPYTKFEASD
jgi:hypothetical protein